MESYINGEFSKAFVLEKLVYSTDRVVDLIAHRRRRERSWRLGFDIMKLIAQELDLELRIAYVPAYIDRDRREGDRQG